VTDRFENDPPTRRDFALAAAAALGVAATGLHAQTPDAGDVLKSELLMDIELDVGAPQNLGTRMIVPVTGGTFSGPKLKGKALGNGGDWISVRPDGASELSVRVTLQTDDDQLIYMTYGGVLYGPPANKAGMYWRTTPRFETGSAKYEWLNRVVAVGVGRQVPKKAAYRVFHIL
jgi:hypothetical protein